MEPWLQSYEAMIQSQPPCDDSWFPQALAQYRSGNDEAGRRISGSCLRLARELAQEQSKRQLGYSLAEYIAEANAGIVDALQLFSGSTATEFIQLAGDSIRRRFENLSAVSK